MRHPWSTLPATALALLGLACASESAPERKDLEAAAAAALGAEKAKEDEEAEAKAAEKRRKAFEEKQAEEAALDAKLATMVDRFVGLPPKVPKTLDGACTDLIETYENWIRAIYFDDDGAQLAFFDAKSKSLGEVKGKCAKVGSVEAAACMIHVIGGVSAPDVSEEDRKLLQGKPDHLFDACAAKYPKP